MAGREWLPIDGQHAMALEIERPVVRQDIESIIGATNAVRADAGGRSTSRMFDRRDAVLDAHLPDLYTARSDSDEW